MKSRIRTTGWLLFLIYIALMVYFLFFSERYGRTAGEEYRYNLELFAEIKRFFKYRRYISRESFILNMFGNVAAFMPFGFFIPMLSKKRGVFRIICLSFELTLAVELTQLVTKVGIFDVDDLLLNTLGGLAGYLLYEIVYYFYRLKYHRKR